MKSALNILGEYDQIECLPFNRHCLCSFPFSSEASKLKGRSCKSHMPVGEGFYHVLLVRIIMHLMVLISLLVQYMVGFKMTIDMKKNKNYVGF